MSENDRANGEQHLDEMDVHKAIMSKPEILEKGLGIKMEQSSLEHHYLLSEKGGHIDFVFRDVSGVVYLTEVKLGVSPIDVVPQLMGHEYKKFKDLNPDVPQEKIAPVVVTDEESIEQSDKQILHGMSIRLCSYNLAEVREVLDQVKIPVTIPSFELPDSGELEVYVRKLKELEENYGDIAFLLQGFQGDDWWDGYFDFRMFWLWKQGKVPDQHHRVYQMLMKREIDDCIWYTFLAAISENHKVADQILDQNWGWQHVITCQDDASRWAAFSKTLKSGPWSNQALLAYSKREAVVREYLSMVGSSQHDFFLDLISDCATPFDAYNAVLREMRKIANIGPVVAAEFATFLSQWRILPIVPTEKVRISRFVENAMKRFGVLRLGESCEEALLRLAQKYSVAPIVIERAMHKLGRSGQESPSASQ